MSKTYFNISDKLRLYEFDGMLDQYGDAAAAYSLRKLRNGYTGDAIRVRRSSDNTERDMGFYDNELDTVALLDWVNAEYVRLQTNFALNTIGVAFDGSPTLETGASALGRDDVLKITVGTSVSRMDGISAQTGMLHRIEFGYYIPDTSGITSLGIVSAGAVVELLTTKGEWVDVNLELTAGNIQFVLDWYNESQGDVIYISDITLTQLTADGHVHTWYDQSANANHAVQGTDSRQPKIVDAGTLVTEGSKPTITFDGVDDILNMSFGPVSDPNISVIGALNMTGNNQAFLNADGMASDGFKTYFGRYTYASTLLNTDVLANGTQTFLAFHANGSNSSFKAKNTTSDNTVTADLTGVTWGAVKNIGARGNGVHPMAGDISELIIYDTSKQSVSDDIEFNVNTYYEIY